MQGRRVVAVPGDDPESDLAVSPDVAAAFNLPTEQELPLSFGRRSLALSVRISAHLPPGTIGIPRSAAQRLLLPLPAEMGLFWQPGSGCRLGPFVALLISTAKMEKILQGKEDTVYYRYSRYAQELGALLCFCSAAGFSPESEVLRGVVMTPTGWQERLFPLPQVIYDRCFGAAGRAEARLVRQMAGQRGILVINQPVKITKLASFAILSRDPELQQWLPETLPLTRENLLAASQRHPALYLKPDSLYRGQGICRIRRLESGWVAQWAQSADSPSAPTTRVQSLDQIWEQLPGEPPYLIQEAIPLATYLGNPYDFRVMVQKDGAGNWQVTGAVARIAPVEGVITSPRSGGLVSPVPRVLTYSFGRERGRAIWDLLEAVALGIATRMEEELGPCSELGLDLAVRPDGHLQVIEVNGKPLKVSLSRLVDPQVMSRINRYPIYYAAYLDLATGARGEGRWTG